MSAYLLNKLHRAAVEAVEYVASANYPEREREALRALEAAFHAAYEGRAKDIVFRVDEDSIFDEDSELNSEETTECPSPAS